MLLTSCQRRSADDQEAAARVSVPQAEAEAPTVTVTALTVAADAKRRDPAAYPVGWSQELELATLDDVDVRWKRRDEVPCCDLQRGEQTVAPTSCEQWADLRMQGYEPATTLEETGDGAALIRCGTLHLLRKAQPATRSFVRELAFDGTLLPLLPAEFATAMSRTEVQAVAAASAAGKSLLAMNPRARAKWIDDLQCLEIDEGQGDSILLHKEAWGDFDGDGVDDLVVGVRNLTSGSASQSRLLVLTRLAPDAPMHVISPPEPLLLHQRN